MLKGCFSTLHQSHCFQPTMVLIVPLTCCTPERTMGPATPETAGSVTGSPFKPDQLEPFISCMDHWIACFA
jgi:hypothetical protein